MKKYIAIVAFALSCVNMMAQDVRIDGPQKKQPVQPTTPKPSNPKSAPKTNTTPQTKTVEVNYDSYNNAITYGDNVYRMVPVAAGIFTIGSSGGEIYTGDGHPHRVAVSSFCMGQTEVPQGLWKAVMGTNPSANKGDNLPVENVSWNDCQEFIGKLNSLTGETFTLPTEAEWEFAARGGNLFTQYKDYSGSKYADDVAWSESNSNGKTHPVGTKRANELNLYDMSGNVSEWCMDWRGEYNKTAETDPRGAFNGTERVHRGGKCDGYMGTMISRWSLDPNKRDKFIGLRLCSHSADRYDLSRQGYSQAFSERELSWDKPKTYNVTRVNVMSNGQWNGWENTSLKYIIDPSYDTIELKTDEPLLLRIIQVDDKGTDSEGTEYAVATLKTTDESSRTVGLRQQKFKDGSKFYTLYFSESDAICFSVE